MGGCFCGYVYGQKILVRGFDVLLKFLLHLCSISRKLPKMPLPRTFLIMSVRFLSVFLVLLYSCNSPISDKEQIEKEKVRYEHALFKARQFAVLQADSALLYADSALKIAYRYNFGDSSLIRYYQLRAGFFAARNQLDSSVSNWDRVISIAEKSMDSLLLAESCLKLGELYLSMENLELAEKNLTLAKKIFHSLGNATGLATVDVRLGRIFTNKGDIEASQKIMMEACFILDSLNLPIMTSDAFLVIGNNFATIGSQDDAIFYTLKAYKLALSAKHWEGAVNALTNIGVSYRYINNDSSIYYYQKAIQVAKETGFHGADMIIRYNLASAFMKKNDMYDHYKATNELYNPMPLYDSILSESQARNFPDGMIRAYSGKAVVAELSGNIGLAKKYLGEAIVIADSIGDKTLELSLKKELARIYRERGELAAYDKITVQVNLLNDSILNTEKQIAIHTIEQKYQNQRIELENTNLENKLDYEKESARYRLVVILIMVIVLIGISLVTIFIYRLLKQRSKAYDALIERHEETKAKPLFLSSEPETAALPETHDDLAIVDSKTVIQQLQLFFENEKPFLNPALKAEELAEHINIPYKSIQIALKVTVNSNFKSFVNRYRVNEMIRMFGDPEYLLIKTETIAEKAGFGSRQSFYSAFELVTGVKPGYYRRYLKKRDDKA
jgi:AraC-like DNA-binding protein